VRLAGAGITFNGDTAAANELDDYEEGTWTPIDSSGAGLTFTSTAGSYTKIGNLCYVSGALTFPSTADASSAIIGGLPFNPSSEPATAQNYSIKPVPASRQFLKWHHLLNVKSIS
jgi:hypothetical protein